MSSRGSSRDRSRTPSRPYRADDHEQMRSPPRNTRSGSEAVDTADRRPTNGRRTRSRSPSGDRSRSRSRSYRARSYSRSHSRSRTRTRSPSPPRSAKIVIEKLTKNINAAHLHEIFSKYGPVTDLEMPMNKQFMTNRGIAYVLFAETRDAEQAIAHMHEAQLDGAQINVSIVLPRRRFSRSPPLRRPPPNRFGEPHRFREPGPGGRGPPQDRGYGRPGSNQHYRGERDRGTTWQRDQDDRNRTTGGIGSGGYRGRYDEPRHNPRQPSYSPNHSPRRGGSAARSRSPPRRRDYSSPPRGGAGPERVNAGVGGGGGGRRRRSPSYDSYGSRGYSPDRGHGRDHGRTRR